MKKEIKTKTKPLSNAEKLKIILSRTEKMDNMKAQFEDPLRPRSQEYKV